MTIPPPCLLSLHILFSAGLLFPLFLPQDTVNTLSDFLRFFHFLFQCKIPLIECFPLGGQLGVFFFPWLCRDYGLAVHHAFKIIFRRVRCGCRVPFMSGVEWWLLITVSRPQSRIYQGFFEIINHFTYNSIIPADYKVF